LLKLWRTWKRRWPFSGGQTRRTRLNSAERGLIFFIF
jgi:hypothetical protein